MHAHTCKARVDGIKANVRQKLLNTDNYKANIKKDSGNWKAKINEMLANVRQMEMEKNTHKCKENVKQGKQIEINRNEPKL